MNIANVNSNANTLISVFNFFLIFKFFTFNKITQYIFIKNMNSSKIFKNLLFQKAK
jgi:hypothetical protein